MTIKISTLIGMPPPKELKAGISVKITDSVRMEKIMKLYNSIFQQTENNKMSKIWEVDEAIIFTFKYKDKEWEFPVNRIHYFCTYWKDEMPKEWWISFSDKVVDKSSVVTKLHL